MKICQYKLLSWLGAIILAFGLLGMLAGTARADEAEDKLGNWMGLLSTVRFSDHWGIFGQGEVRLWEPASNLNEILWRFAGHFGINPIAMVGLGYVRVDTWSFDDDNDSSRIRIENRCREVIELKTDFTQRLAALSSRRETPSAELTALVEDFSVRRVKYRKELLGVQEELRQALTKAEWEQVFGKAS